MAGDRPPIPSEIRRRVLVEAGHRCSIPTCRYIEVDVHHIEPWAQSQAHEYENLIALCPNCHRRADRGDIDRKSLRLYKLNLRFAHDKFSQLEIDVMLMLFSAPQNAAVPWSQMMIILLRRALDAQYLAISKDENFSMQIAGVEQVPIHVSLTKKGREFVAELGVVEL